MILVYIFVSWLKDEMESRSSSILDHFINVGRTCDMLTVQKMQKDTFVVVSNVVD
jgi:hypothetical protein